MNCVLEIYVHDVIMTINICGDFLTLIDNEVLIDSKFLGKRIV